MLQLYHSSFRPLNMFLNRSNKGKRCKTTSDLVPSSKLLWIILGSEATIDTNRPRIKICSNHTHMPYARILIDEIRRLHLWFRQFLSAHRCLYRRRHQAINQRKGHIATRKQKGWQGTRFRFVTIRLLIVFYWHKASTLVNPMSCMRCHGTCLFRRQQIPELSDLPEYQPKHWMNPVWEAQSYQVPPKSYH